MRVLFDAVHGADVWALGALDDRLRAEGATTRWLSRPGKEAVVELLDALGRDHVPGPRAGRSVLGLAAELPRRDWRAWRLVRRFAPDVVVTRSPAGVHAARLAGVPVVYDTDDGDVAGLLFRVAGPFADVITSPAANRCDLGARHRRYRGYKELAYVHPDRFRPDPAIRAELGVAPGERLFVVRLTAFTASHDRGESGMGSAVLAAVVERLGRAGRVVVSSEAPLPSGRGVPAVPVPQERFHHVLAAADLVVGDGQTVCAEAAVLGTPSLRCNSWVGRHSYQEELERRWGLTRSFGPDEGRALLAAIDEVLADPDGSRRRQLDARDRMLAWAEDPVDVLAEVVRDLAGSQNSTTEGGVTAVQASGF